MCEQPIEGLTAGNPAWFQKDSSGVEARRTEGRPANSRQFQKDSSGVEATSRNFTTTGTTGFRRTLVGLKHESKLYHDWYNRFQKDSSGVEANNRVHRSVMVVSFQKDSSGVEAGGRRENTYRSIVVSEGL